MNIIKFSFLVFYIVSCGKPTDHTPPRKNINLVDAHFANAEVTRQDLFQINLSFVDMELPTLQYQGFLQQNAIGDAAKSIENFPATKGVAIKFSNLNERQFLILKDHYGAGLATTSFDRSAEYWLSDFLPPIMQATIGQIVTNGDVYANCWGTLYEVQRRLKDSFFVFYADENSMFSSLSDDRYSQLIATIPPSEVRSLPIEKIMYLDAILIVEFKNGEQKLVHAATYLDTNLVYEKLSLQLPYRLSTVKQLLADYPSATFVIRRFTGDRLQNPVEIFENKLESIAEVFLETDKFGKSVIRKKQLIK